MSQKKLAFRKAVPPAIQRITVAGYKSISRAQSIEIQPLTILAGANSSGKSSIMQPLLLLKQTLEAVYNPGTLLLDGANIKFTSAEQMFSRSAKGKRGNSFLIGLEDSIGNSITIHFTKPARNGLVVTRMDFSGDGNEGSLRMDTPAEEIAELLAKYVSVEDSLLEKIKSWLTVQTNRCFPEVALVSNQLQNGSGENSLVAQTVWEAVSGLGTHRFSPLFPGRYFTPYVTQMIHLPGLRGNPERNYPVTGEYPSFSGTFENYTAGVISQWQAQAEESKLKKLAEELKHLGLTWKVVASPVNDTRVELSVARLPQSCEGATESSDLVSIADVGLGVSQTLPVLVALHAAKSGQLVYLEQPEIHLHPRAQTAMAQVLANAAMRGVRVVAETHSSLLLLGIQTLVAEGKLPPELVKLHWFTRGKDGATTIRSADLDETGAFGDWPEDFADVELAAESRYLDAAEARQRVH